MQSIFLEKSGILVQGSNRTAWDLDLDVAVGCAKDGKGDHHGSGGGDERSPGAIQRHGGVASVGSTRFGLVVLEAIATVITAFGSIEDVVAVSIADPILAMSVLDLAVGILVLVSVSGGTRFKWGVGLVELDAVPSIPATLGCVQDGIAITVSNPATTIGVVNGAVWILILVFVVSSAGVSATGDGPPGRRIRLVSLETVTAVPATGLRVILLVAEAVADPSAAVHILDVAIRILLDGPSERNDGER